MLLWPANQFQQVNPQTTDKTGNYSFLVPPGTYELTATAPGYYGYTGQEFIVAQGAGVHDAYDVLAGDSRDRRRLEGKALDGLAGRHCPGKEGLEGHTLPEDDVLRLVDNPHPTAAEDPLDAAAGELAACL